MTTTPRTVVLIAATYPFAGAFEETFLRREVEILAETWDRVVLAPEDVRGALLPLPAKAEVDRSLAAALNAGRRARRLLDALTVPLVPEDVLARPAIVRDRVATKRLLDFAARAAAARRWARRRFEPSSTLFYTFWWGPLTTGFGLDREHPAIVSRAHGFDLYEERHAPPYLPCRKRSLRALDALFPVSDRGREYAAERYGTDASTPIETARLGVRGPTPLCMPSSDGQLRAVSCSFMVDVKRLGLLLDGLVEAGRRRPGLQIVWTHHGIGPLRDSLAARARELPPNVRCELPGYVDQAHLLRRYAEEPADVFVNVSASEGVPVSIMEAIACGIPILATAVGGNPEIAGAGNGILLPPDPTPTEIAHALFRFVDDPEAARAMRAASRRLWSESYDAERNLRAFSARLHRVLDARSAVR